MVGAILCRAQAGLASRLFSTTPRRLRHGCLVVPSATTLDAFEGIRGRKRLRADIRFFSARSDVTCRSDSPFVSILDDQDLLAEIPLEDVRNFCFIAHIDHGKSSLSSRLLELTGNLGREAQTLAWETALERGVTDIDAGTVTVSGKEQIELLDTLAVEQERGITVKASTASMLYRHPSAVGPTGTLLISKFIVI